MRLRRRDALKAVAACGIGAVVPTILTDESQAGQVSLLRRNVGTLDPNGPELSTYRRAVAAMQMLPNSDPRSWEAQARIHNDFCPHGNWFFLPWHRAYLHAFERICQQLGSDPTFRLPYWNWTSERQIPAFFWGPANVLNHVRDVTQNDSLFSEWVGESIIDTILSTTDFSAFASLPHTCPSSPTVLPQRRRCGSGMLEATPHNNVHGWVGRDMASYMSPRDPIFWLHHANIDRLWSLWNLVNPNSTDPSWLNFTFAKNFAGPDGAQIDAVRVSGLLSTAALGYGYDTDPAPAPILSPSVLTSERIATSSAGWTAVGNQAVGMVLDAGDGGRRLAEFARSPTPVEDVGLRIQINGLAPPPAGAKLRVFLNCPYLSEATPSHDPHYVATLAFFGPHDEPTSFVLDAARTIQRLGRLGRYDGSQPLEVQIVAMGRQPGQPAPEETRVVPSGVEITLVGRSRVSRSL